MALEKMTITAYDKDTFDGASQAGSPFAVTINPESYVHKYKIDYNDRQVQGSNGAAPEFRKVAVDQVDFTLVFDGTGVVAADAPRYDGKPPVSAKDRVDAFRNLVFKYEGAAHSPKFLKLVWGTLVFHCRLQSMDLTYTLFKPDGSPLRAKAQLSFLGYTAKADLARDAGNESPDLSHLVTVKAGDTLPLICFQAYGDSRHYLEVARVNRLSSVQALSPGMKLLLPPLAAARA